MYREKCLSCLLVVALGVVVLPLGAQEKTRLRSKASSESVRATLNRLLFLSPQKRWAKIGTRELLIPLSQADAELAHQRLWAQYVKESRAKLKSEWDKKVIQLGKRKMKFEFRLFGKKPKNGWDFYISLHGGGATTPEVNDSQWRNQIRLYSPKQGLYLAPRAPTDSWNMWHQAHIDEFLDRLIEGAIIHMGVNPNRVYIMGYSAGGDGVYQLAPRMADRWAAAAMMAGHPNETSPLGLRNIGFILQVGALDSAFKRNQVANEWRLKLAALRTQDPQGYPHEVRVHPGLGHWMKRQDAIALGWMAKFTRNPYPHKVVWKQDDVIHEQFYWLVVPLHEAKSRAEITAEIKGQEITLSSVSGIKKVVLLLNDEMLDLEKNVVVVLQGKKIFAGRLFRTLSSVLRSRHNRHDPLVAYTADLTLELN